MMFDQFPVPVAFYLFVVPFIVLGFLIYLCWEGGKND